MNTTWWQHSKGEIGEHLKEQLDNLIAGKNYYPYSENYTNYDKPSQPITYNVYGAIDENSLYCKLDVDGKTYYGKINSGVLWPAMIDRMWGMDEMDAQYVGWLSDMMCHVYLDGKNEEEVLILWDKGFEEEKKKRNE